MTTASPDLFSSSNFILELDGAPTSIVRSIEGAVIKTEMLTYHANAQKGAIWRQNGKLKYEPIKVVSGLSAGLPLYNWMNSFCTGDCTRKTGAIVAADFNYMEKARRTFKEAIIESIDFPKFDANDKNPANVTITIQPETLVYEPPADGAKIGGSDNAVIKQQHVSACNFEFIYDNFSKDPIKRVTKVDGFSLKSKTIEYHHGGRLDPLKIAGKIEQPNVTFYMPEIDAAFFIKLMADAVKGIRPPQSEAALRFFDNQKAVQGEIHFKGCHVFNVQPDKLDATNEDVRQVKIEMAIESLTFTRN
jgi:phage tail-like protein